LYLRSVPDRYASLTASNRVNASRDRAIRQLKPVSSAANYPATISLVCKVSFSFYLWLSLSCYKRTRFKLVLACAMPYVVSSCCFCFFVFPHTQKRSYYSTLPGSDARTDGTSKWIFLPCPFSPLNFMLFFKCIHRL
jgi:hypothetical protein